MKRKRWFHCSTAIFIMAILSFFLGLNRQVFAGHIRLEMTSEIDIKADFISDGSAISSDGAGTTYEKRLTARQRQLMKEIRDKQYASMEESISWIFNMAEKSSKRGDYEETLYLVRFVLALDPLYTRANELRMLCLKILKLYDQGIREYEALKVQFPDNIMIKNYISLLQQLRDDQKLLSSGIKKAVQEASALYKSDRSQGIQEFQRIITTYSDAHRNDEVIQAILMVQELLDKDGNWDEAIKISNRFLELNKSEVNAREWNAIQKNYVKIFEDVIRYFGENNDYLGYTKWLTEFRNIENKRFAAENGDMMRYYEGLALMRARKYEEAQAVFLNLYLNQPSSKYSKEAKQYYDGCKRAIKGVVVLTIISDPPKADIYIDEMLRGSTPVKIEVPDKDFSLKVLHESYQSYEKKISPNAAEGDLNLSIKLKSCVITFVSGHTTRNPYCPGVVMEIKSLGTVRWHDSCFELGKLEVTGPIEKISENSIRIAPGTFMVTASSFGELYKNTGRHITEEVDFPADGNVVITVEGAFIDDQQLPYRLTFSVR